MSLADYYGESYPPELWETPAAPVAASRRTATDEAGTVPAGTVPALPAAEDVQVSDVETMADKAAAAFLAASSLPELLTVIAGTPGTYSPAIPAGDRPGNVTELAGRATPASPDAWEPGQYVPVGSRGKRAHWDGEAWRSGEAPPFQTRARRTAPVGVRR